MTFFALIVRNVTRQKTRSGLTMLGIGIGITTVIALGLITEGLKASAGDLVRTGGADFMVAQKGASDTSFSAVSAEDWDAVARTPGVLRATGMLLHITRVGDIPFFVLLGIPLEDLPSQQPSVLSGRLPETEGEMLLGERAAENLDIAAGDTLSIGGRHFAVVGVHRADNAWADNGAYAALAVVQEIARKRDTVTAVFVAVEPGADAGAVAAGLEAAHPQLTAIAGADEYADVDQGVQLLDAGNLAISLLAVIIGAVGVMNTMAMSVFERTREIGILRAVGWRSSRILRMIVGESLLLCVFAAILGTAAGIIATRLLALLPAIGDYLEPVYEPRVFVRALVVAVLVALAGAAYPAYRALRLTPMEALRHE